MRTTTYSARSSQRMLALEGAQLAPFNRRAFAFVIDFMIVGTVFIAVTLTAIPLVQKWGWFSGDVHVSLNFSNWYSIVVLVLYFGLCTYFGKGQTPGKKLMRIRVVSTVHERLGLWHSLERALGYGASTLEGGFGFVQFFLTENRQTVHDRIAETIVIAVRKSSAHTD